MKAKVHVTLKYGVLDPQGKAVQHALGALGFAGVDDVRQGKFSVRHAREAYGVAVNARTLKLEARATAALRAKGRNAGPRDTRSQMAKRTR